MTRVIGTILRVLVVGLVLLASAMFLFPDEQRRLPSPTVATLLNDADPLPYIQLTDKTGQTFTSAELSNQFSLLFFGFTHCPDICPLTLSILATMHRDWSTPHISPPEVVFISVDPNRDNPTQISNYLANFDSNFQGVTGRREAMDPWLKALGVSVHIQHQPDGQPYNVTHNSTIYVVGPETKLLAVFSAPHDAATIAADFLKIRQHYFNNPLRSSDPQTL